MLPAALRLLAATMITSVIVSATTAAAPGGRAAPSRPATESIAVRRIGRVQYVNVADIAERMSLKLTWLVRGAKLTLTGPGARAEIERDTRDIEVNGVRVFLGDPVVDANGALYVSRIDFERCLAPMLRPGHGVAALPAPRTVVLDPGHGGKDQGTSVNEKTFALDVARRTKKILEAAGLRVVLTRDKDEFLTLTERPAIAHANKADLFVSIHFNALANDRKTSGVEVYTFPPESQRSTGAWSLGERNNAEDEASPVNRYDHWSAALAHAIHRRFVGDLKTFDRGKKLMHLGVLRSLKCPGVLVECGFLTSNVEAKKIATPAYRQQIAEALAAGVRDYVATLGRLSGKAKT